MTKHVRPYFLHGKGTTYCRHCGGTQNSDNAFFDCDVCDYALICGRCVIPRPNYSGHHICSFCYNGIDVSYQDLMINAIHKKVIKSVVAGDRRIFLWNSENLDIVRELLKADIIKGEFSPEFFAMVNDG